MPLHADFVKIKKRFVSQYGEKKGTDLYYAWVNKKKLDDTKPFPKKTSERKEFNCVVCGLEIKEDEESFHVVGLIATDHVDNLPDIPDWIPSETLDSFAEQINTDENSRIMGVHHSEGHPFNPEYFGKADVENTPAKVIELSDGHHGLYVDNKLLKHDVKTPDIIEQINSGELNSFSITYDTNGFSTTDFDWLDDELVRVLKPDTRIYGYTLANRPVNPNAVITGYGFKEFKELVGEGKTEKKEVINMTEEKIEKDDAVAPAVDKPVEKVEEKVAQPSVEKSVGSEAEASDDEKKEFAKWKEEKKSFEQKELLEKTVNKAIKGALKDMEVKEKVIKQTSEPSDEKKVPLEVKEFIETLKSPKTVEIKEQFMRAASASDALGIDWRDAVTTRVDQAEFKNFTVNGRELEFKGLGITTNQNTDTDYLQSAPELRDLYDPVIYNLLNQATLTWNVLTKDDYSSKGNNMVQFKSKIAANSSAAFYTGNSVSTDNVTRQTYQTKFKKIQVGVSVDGDMIAAARGGPVSDVFAQEVMDSTMDMLAVVNAALYAEVGLETASAIIGFEYITDSAGNTTLYNLTRSTTNLLAPDSATDTYINGNSANITPDNLRKAKRQCTNDGSNKSDLVFFTSPTQGDILRGIMDDTRRTLSPRETSFGFTTDLFFDGIPIFEDKDCNADDWFCVDVSAHRIAIWKPPTVEKLGKTSDSEDAFIKMYFCTYNRAPRRMVQIYGNSTTLI